MSILKKLSIPVLSSILALAPLKSNALEGIVKNSMTDEGIHNAIVKLYDGETLKDSVRTDEDGYYSVNVTSVKEPDFNIPNKDVYDVKVFDMNGRFLYNLGNSWNGSFIPNLPSGSYIFNTPYGNFMTPVIEGSLLSPLGRSLESKVGTSKNTYRTSNADEAYTLSVSDDGIENEIGDYYDASIPINDLNSNRDVELIHSYEMQDWDGDFLEYLKTTQYGGNTLWGDYPEYYPINVDIDSVNCDRYTGERAQGVLNDIRDALDGWNEMSGLELFTYTDVNRDNRQIIVDYSKDEGFPQFRGHQVRDEDGRYRFDSGTVYLINDMVGGDYGEEMIKHEFGHATGWGNESPNEQSIMRPSIYIPYVTISEDDGYVVRTFTTLPNFTPWNNYLLK